MRYTINDLRDYFETNAEPLFNIYMETQDTINEDEIRFQDNFALAVTATRHPTYLFDDEKDITTLADELTRYFKQVLAENTL